MLTASAEKGENSRVIHSCLVGGVSNPSHIFKMVPSPVLLFLLFPTLRGSITSSERKSLTSIPVTLISSVAVRVALFIVQSKYTAQHSVGCTAGTQETGKPL